MKYKSLCFAALAAFSAIPSADTHNGFELAVVYEHTYGQGRKFALMPSKGLFSSDRNWFPGFFNDKVTSIYIPKGSSITLYEHAHGGSSIKLEGDGSIIEVGPRGFNDRASSWAADYNVPETDYVSAPSTDDNGTFTVTWATTPGAEKYKVYRRKSEGGWQWSGWTLLSSVTSTSYTEYSLDEGKYEYSVHGCVDGVCSPSGTESRYVNVYRAPGKPYSLKVTEKDEETLEITWGAPSRASSYVLQYQKDKGQWVTHSSTLYSTKKNFSVSNGSTYRFRVKACHSRSSVGCSSYTSATTPYEAFFIPNTPSEMQLAYSAKDGGYILLWDPSDRVTAYFEIARMDGTIIASDIRDSVYSIRQFQPMNGKHHYKIRACSDKGRCSDYTEMRSFSNELLNQDAVSSLQAKLGGFTAEKLSSISQICSLSAEGIDLSIPSSKIDVNSLNSISNLEKCISREADIFDMRQSLMIDVTSTDQQPELLSSEDSNSIISRFSKTNRVGISSNQYSSFQHHQRTLKVLNMEQESDDGSQIPAADVIIVNAEEIKLNAKIELVGETADLVIISPNDIECDGCSFEGFSRVTLVSGTAEIDETTGAIGTLTAKAGNTITLKNVKAPGVLSLDVIADQAVVDGVGMNMEARLEGTESYILDPEGDKVVSSGGLNLFLGTLVVDYTQQKVIRTQERKKAKSRYSFFNTQTPEVNSGDSTIMGSVDAAAIHIQTNGALTVDKKARLNTLSDALMTSDYQGQYAPITEQVQIFQIEPSKAVTVHGKILSDKAVIIDTAGGFTNHGDIYGKREVTLRAGGYVLNVGNIDSVAKVIATGQSLVNRGNIEGGEVRLVTDKSLLNEFGGLILGGTVQLISQNELVRNGSLYPYMGESRNTRDRRGDLLKKDDPTNIGLMSREGTVKHRHKTSRANIIGDRVEIKAKYFENINPYYVWRQHDRIDLNTRLSNQVSVTAEKSLDILAPEYVLNASARIGVNRPDGVFQIASAFVDNERYRVETYVDVKLNGPVEHNKQTKLAFYSPPGRMYSFGDFNARGSIGLTNNTSFFEVFGDARLNYPSGKVKSIGLHISETSKFSVTKYYLNGQEVSKYHCDSLKGEPPIRRVTPRYRDRHRNRPGFDRERSIYDEIDDHVIEISPVAQCEQRIVAKEGFHDYRNAVERETLFHVTGNVYASQSNLNPSNHDPIEKGMAYVEVEREAHYRRKARTEAGFSTYMGFSEATHVGDNEPRTVTVWGYRQKKYCEREYTHHNGHPVDSKPGDYERFEEKHGRAPCSYHPTRVEKVYHNEPSILSWLDDYFEEEENKVKRKIRNSTNWWNEQ
ncbi:fibronectin type III domain-containing protein [Algicola sagamiensis]|uniref:hypothetical protein n=1 Tax=Algicola sagamiensis TaxID=163869 RepID=UPI00035E46D5|nr:hypothetical protein [Algicola sagamiensis]